PSGHIFNINAAKTFHERTCPVIIPVLRGRDADGWEIYEDQIEQQNPQHFQPLQNPHTRESFSMIDCLSIFSRIRKKSSFRINFLTLPSTSVIPDVKQQNDLDSYHACKTAILYGNMDAFAYI